MYRPSIRACKRALDINISIFVVPIGLRMYPGKHPRMLRMYWAFTRACIKLTKLAHTSPRMYPKRHRACTRMYHRFEFISRQIGSHAASAHVFGNGSLLRACILTPLKQCVWSTMAARFVTFDDKCMATYHSRIRGTSNWTTLERLHSFAAPPPSSSTRVVYGASLVCHIVCFRRFRLRLRTPQGFVLGASLVCHIVCFRFQHLLRALRRALYMA